MEFIQENMGTIIVGAVVLAVLAGVVIRLVQNARRGKSACGCPDCPGCNKAPLKVVHTKSV
jgi:hypothetical protein